MAQTSYPFDGSSVSETLYSQFFRQLQDTGVAGSINGLDLKASGDSSGMNVKVQPGFAIVRGHAYQSTAVETLTIAAADSSAVRIDLVVLRLDPAANSIVLAVLTGTAGGSEPAPTQTDTGNYELPLAAVTVAANATTISSANVADRRRYTGTRVRAWTTDTRPSGPRVGQLGFNSTTSLYEYWSGSIWLSISPTVEWTQIQNLPTLFAPAAHTHSLGDVNAPSGFPPASHSHTYSQITEKPSTFAPAPHTHAWSDITNEPAFAPVSHSHSQYLTGSGTIDWAQGSKRPYNNAASGSNWYAVWVENGGDFCRNTSAAKFKENIRDYEIDPDVVLKLRPVIYDRKDKVDDETGDVVEGRKNEVGLIADRVDELGMKWMVNYLDGEVDGLRYDLLGVALLPVVQRQAKQIADLAARLDAMERRHGGGK